jgi:hypothetical protein
MSLATPERGPDAGATELNRPDGRSALDPAHAGPLPQATFPELVGRLINDVSDLADRQIELAKQEINEAKDDALGEAKRIGIGAGIAIAAVVLLVIWLWTAFIWFFNWLGALILIPFPAIALVGGAVVGAVAAYWIASPLLEDWRKFAIAVGGFIVGGLIGDLAGLGWLLGMLVPAVAGGVAYRYIRRGVFEAMAIWPPLPRTRDTLKGNLEWLQALRTPNAR